MYRIIHLDETDSTNKYIKNLAAAGERGICVIADRQSAGRGRLGRTFESPEGGLYMSFICTSTDVVGDALTAKTAVAAARAIERLTGLPLKIKWVNDLYAGERKLCGILAEGVWNGGELDCIVIGIGVNLYGTLPDYLENIATTVESAGGQVPEREELAGAILEEFNNLTDFYEEYKSRQLLLGCSVAVHRGDDTFYAVAEEIDENCAVILRLDDGSRVTLSSGEISLRRRDYDGK